MLTLNLDESKRAEVLDALSRAGIAVPRTPVDDAFDFFAALPPCPYFVVGGKDSDGDPIGPSTPQRVIAIGPLQSDGTVKVYVHNDHWWVGGTDGVKLVHESQLDANP